MLLMILFERVVVLLPALIEHVPYKAYTVELCNALLTQAGLRLATFLIEHAIANVGDPVGKSSIVLVVLRHIAVSILRSKGHEFLKAMFPQIPGTFLACTSSCSGRSSCSCIIDRI